VNIALKSPIGAPKKLPEKSSFTPMPVEDDEPVTLAPCRASHSNPLPCLKLDSLYYTKDAAKLYCDVTFPEPNTFPRPLICADGTALQVSFIEGSAGCSREPLARVCFLVPSSIRALCDRCLQSWRDLSALAFEPDSNLSSIGKDTFAPCLSLSSICVPSSVETLSQSCFWGCERLSAVFFESNSKLSKIGDDAFADCVSLSAISIPASVEVLCSTSFFHCESLLEVSFASDSKLSRIEEEAFLRCSSVFTFTFRLNCVTWVMTR
jgi:hypothetical protein